MVALNRQDARADWIRHRLTQRQAGPQSVGGAAVATLSTLFSPNLVENRYNARTSSHRPTRTQCQTMPNSLTERLTIAHIDESCEIYRIDELQECTTLCLTEPDTLEFKPELAISLIDADEVEDDEDEDEDDDTDDEDDDDDFDADGLDEDEDDDEDDEDDDDFDDDDEEDDDDVEAEPDSE